jgi:hypothetical protein
LAFFGKPGRCTCTTQKRWPVGACITTQRSQAIHNLGAQLPQASRFGRDIVGLDVYVYETLVVHALDLHDGLVGRGLQHAAIATAARMVRVYRATQRFAPEAGSLVHIGGLTVDQYGA